MLYIYTIKCTKTLKLTLIPLHYELSLNLWPFCTFSYWNWMQGIYVIDKNMLNLKLNASVPRFSLLPLFYKIIPNVIKDNKYLFTLLHFVIFVIKANYFVIFKHFYLWFFYLFLFCFKGGIFFLSLCIVFCNRIDRFLHPLGLI